MFIIDVLLLSFVLDVAQLAALFYHADSYSYGQQACVK